jgi:hypothetical protein
MRWLLAEFTASIAAVASLAACGARSSLPVREAADGGTLGQDAPPVPPSCADAGTTFIYVLTSQLDLFAFYPPNASFTLVGKINCPDMDPNGQSQPFSMAVDRKGSALAVYFDGRLFEVSTKDASCKATPFLPGQQGFGTFGMGFAADGPGSDTETLYVAEGHPGGGGPSLGLATIDTSTFELDFIAPFSGGDVGTGGELTGTGTDGRLFTYFMDPSGQGSHIAEVDKATAALHGDVTLPFGDLQSAFAFAYWGGAFYTFTAPNNGGTLVHRYDPSDDSVTLLTINTDTVVGAGVSTCAPQ